LIDKVDGVALQGARHLTQLLSSGREAQLSVTRGGRPMTLRIRPVADERDGVYRVGAWVRDSTAGVGTLSFYDMETGGFGALGHAIADVDTGSVLTVGDGGLFESEIVGITKGERGVPGELIGEFAQGAHRIGDIRSNGDFGIYGEMYSPVYNALYPGGLPVATRNEVRLGAAGIVSTLDGGGAKEYECEIEKLYDQGAPKQRGLVVRITDEALLRATGGIVQGMSGSPIIQDGRIIGAVTHVFVNDPTRGYGIYIDWMLRQAEAGEAAGARRRAS
jgi:stage IV sporulation protein B